MNDQTIKAIVDEVAPILVGGNLGKIFQLSKYSIAMDFRRRDGRYLLLGVDPQPGPRMYLIERRVRDLEKQSLPSSSFVMTLHKRLAAARLTAIEKDPGDRIVRFSFTSVDLAGVSVRMTLVAQLTGRTASLLLLDHAGYVIDILRPARGAVHEGAVKYEPPAAPNMHSSTELTFPLGSFASLSEAADSYFKQIEIERSLAARVSATRARLKKEIGRRVKLCEHLRADLIAHGDADSHKRIGELLLANVGTAERHGESVTVTDYFTEGTPQVVLQVDENVTLQQEAAKRFARYTKARRAAVEIARRLDELEKELQSLNARYEEMESVIAAGDASSFEDNFDKPATKPGTGRDSKTETANVVGTRRYRSSDGFEILVGRGARDNDHLTFRVARPYDLWLHAADYPGSHVIVLNPTRKEVPHRTVIEAAQLAAKFSKARHDGKVDVHYAQRKFLAKPKGAAPGLVRMSNFRTIVVEPGDGIERI